MKIRKTKKKIKKSPIYSKRTKALALKDLRTHPRAKNPSELIKAGEWTPAHAVRIRNGKLEILR